MSSNLDPRKSVRLRDRLPWRRSSPRPSDNTTVSSSTSAATSQNTPSSSQTNKPTAQIAGPSNFSSLQNAPSGPSAATAAISPGQKLLNEALNELSSTQQALTRDHLGSGSDVIDAINKSCDAAKAKQEEWMKTRARCTFRGREFVFAEEADTVFRLLDKVSSVGDMVAASDPIHIGLPWTGVRFILQAVLADHDQKATMVEGLKLSLSMSLRLRVYFDSLCRLPSGNATTAYERTLVELFGSILSFLATAIQNYQKPAAVRAWQAFWDTSDLDTFEETCMGLTTQTDSAASQCEYELSHNERLNARQWRDQLTAGLRTVDLLLQDVKESLLSLHMKFDLQGLKVAAGAAYDAEADGCLPGTREQLLREIDDWANNPGGKRIFWLSGMAGTGKSTIARTFAARLGKKRLGASFFFKRGVEALEDPRKVFPTIVKQLVHSIPALGAAIEQVMSEEPDICDKHIRLQFQLLLLKPLRAAMLSNDFGQQRFIVIDAMDECGSHEAIKLIISLLGQSGQDALQGVRFFLTGRPDLPLQLGFDQVDHIAHHDMRLEKSQAATIEHDIKLYLEEEFRKIRLESQSDFIGEPLPDTWPQTSDLMALVQLAMPLFIFASTVCRFISEMDHEARLKAILSQHNANDSEIGQVYLTLLRSILVAKSSREQDKFKRKFLKIIGPMVLLSDPLSPSALSSLLSESISDVSYILRHLRSVLDISTDPKDPIQLLHLSFRDFLVDEGNTDWCRVEQTQTHAALADQCLACMNRCLRRDICNIEQPGMERTEISIDHVNEQISSDLAYACRYFVKHAISARRALYNDGDVHVFLKCHFLHWMEALSWLGHLHSIIEDLTNMRSLALEGTQATQLTLFLDDAQRFMRRHVHTVNLAPLQIYSSALMFSPLQSVVRQQFLADLSPAWNVDLLEVEHHWDAEARRLQSDVGAIFIRLLVSSPDERSIACVVARGTIQLWDLKTGEALQKLSTGKHETIEFLTYSSNGSVLASHCYDPSTSSTIVYHWDIQTGTLLKTLEGKRRRWTYRPVLEEGMTSERDTFTLRRNAAVDTEVLDVDTYGVHSMSLTPDGLGLVITEPGLLRMYDLRLEKEIWRAKLDCEKDLETLVSVSPDGKCVVAFNGRKALAWHAADGAPMWESKFQQPPDGEEVHTYSVFFTLIFSLDSQLVAAGCSTWDSYLVGVFSATTGAIVFETNDTYQPQFTMRWCFAGHELWAADDSSIIRSFGIMDPNVTVDKNARPPHRRESPASRVSLIEFSPDQQMLATIFNDINKLILWCTTTWTELSRLRLNSFLDTTEILRFSFDSCQVAIGYTEGAVDVAQLIPGKSVDLKLITPLVAAMADSLRLLDIAFASEGRTVAMAYSKPESPYKVEIQLQDIESREHLRTIDVNIYEKPYAVYLCFSLDEGTIALFQSKLHHFEAVHLDTNQSTYLIKGSGKSVEKLPPCRHFMQLKHDDSSGPGLTFPFNHDLSERNISQIGSINTNQGPMHGSIQHGLLCPPDGIRKMGPWIVHKQKKILWVPAEHRSSTPEDLITAGAAQMAMITRDDNLVVIQSNADGRGHHIFGLKPS